MIFVISVSLIIWKCRFTAQLIGLTKQKYPAKITYLGFKQHFQLKFKVINQYN